VAERNENYFPLESAIPRGRGTSHFALTGEPDLLTIVSPRDNFPSGISVISMRFYRWGLAAGVLSLDVKGDTGNVTNGDFEVASPKDGGKCF
jgi:hypothetical protein